MALDEQLRELAAEVPPPPPGDAASVFDRGRRRRRRRQGATFGAAAVVVALLGVAAPSVLPGVAPMPEVADRPETPTTDEEEDASPDVPAAETEPIQPDLGAYSTVPFPYTLVAWSTDERRREWCVAAFTDRSLDEVRTVTADQCQWRFQLDEFPHTGPPLAMGAVEGPDGGLLVWGIERRPDSDSSAQTSVLFDGDVGWYMNGGTGGGVPFGLWSIGRNGSPPEVIEVRDAGETVATLAWPPVEGDDWAADQVSTEPETVPDASPTDGAVNDRALSPAETLVDAAWSDADGTDVPSDVINVIRGPSHCDWESSVWLHLTLPGDDSADRRQYIRDPDEVVPGAFESTLEVDAELPSDASPAGYRTEGAELWRGPDGGAEAIYIVFDDHVERWPRTADEVTCA